MSQSITVSEYISNVDTTLNIRTSGLSSDVLEDNIVDHYIEHLFDLCEVVEFEDADRAIYNKDPKRLSFDLWGTTDLFFIIMIMNDLEHYEDMDTYKINKLYVPSPTRLTFMKKLIDRKLNNNMITMDYE